MLIRKMLQANHLRRLDQILVSMFGALAERRRGEFRIAVSRSDRGQGHAFVSPSETVKVSLSDLSEQVVEDFLSSLEGRFAASRALLIGLTVDAMAAGRQTSIDVRTERRRRRSAIPSVNDATTPKRQRFVIDVTIKREVLTEIRSQ